MSSVSSPDHTIFVEPLDGRAEVLKTIAGARKNITLTIFQLDDPAIVTALAAAQERGVSVRVLAANLQGVNGTNINAPALATLNANGAQAKSITSLYIHAKVAVADYGTPQQVAYVGSEYLAPVSLDQSRELAILVSGQPILDRIESAFSQDWLVPAMPDCL